MHTGANCPHTTFKSTTVEIIKGIWNVKIRLRNLAVVWWGGNEEYRKTLSI